MKIRNVTKEDLRVIAKLAKNKAIRKMENICYKHSKICFSDEGEVLCFIVVCQNSLIDFFKGNIPANEKPINNGDDDYDEDEKWWERDVITLYNGMHYEIVAAYLKNRKDSSIYVDVLNSVENDYYPIGILWSSKELPLTNHFCLFNNKVWLDTPYLD